MIITEPMEDMNGIIKDGFRPLSVAEIRYDRKSIKIVACKPKKGLTINPDMKKYIESQLSKIQAEIIYVNEYLLFMPINANVDLKNIAPYMEISMTIKEENEYLLGALDRLLYK